MPLALLLVLISIAFITMKGSRILMTLYAVDLGAGPFETGILFALYGLFPFMLAIAAGRLADRFDNRLLIYWGLGTYTVSLAIPYFFPSLTTLYLVAPLWGFTSMLWVVATQNLVGVLSQRDCLEVALTAAQDSCIAGPVAQYMSEKPQTVDPETNLTQLATMFTTAPFRRYPVIENGQLVGQISRSDVLRAISHMC